MVERWNRTIKSKLWKHFTSVNSYRWLEVLPKIVQSYNYLKHRIIAMKPIDVNKDNAALVWDDYMAKICEIKRQW